MGWCDIEQLNIICGVLYLVAISSYPLQNLAISSGQLQP